jgi:hypothetical protein
MFLTPIVDFVFFPFSPALLMKVCLWSSHGLTEYMKENEGRMHGLVESQTTTCSSPFLIMGFQKIMFFFRVKQASLGIFFCPK